MSDMTATIGHPPVEVYFGENTQTAVAAAAAAEAAAVAAQAFTNYRATRAEGVADFPVGAYFSSDETGELRIYKRIAGSPFYQDQGDEAAPLTKKTFNEQSARITTRALLPTIALGGGVYAADVNAFYEYDAGSSATVDDWGVIAALGGAGRWLLTSDAVTIYAKGAGQDDAPTLMAAGNAMALLGRSIITPDRLYTMDTIWAWPRDPLRLIAHEGVTFEATLTPDGSPSTAPFYCSAGGGVIVATGELTANALPSATAVVVDVQPSVGQYLRVRDNVSGAQVISGTPISGFTGNTYQVRAVSGSGPWTVTLDRPLRYPLATGDEAVILSDVAKGHRIEGRPTIKGTAVRGVEFIGVWDCELDVRIVADGFTDVGGSFDLFGYRNRVTGEVVKTTGSCKDGWLLESNEDSQMELTVKGFTAGTGISIFHGIDCIDRSRCSGNDIGGALRGYGIHGCIGSGLAGQYDGNISQGAAVINGSRDCWVDGVGRYNSVNLSIGDSAGGNVRRTRVAGDWSEGRAASPTKAIGVLIAATALGTVADSIDTSNTDIGILANGSLSASVHRHHGTAEATTGGVVVATGDALVSIAVLDWAVTNVVNGVRSSGNSIVALASGLYTADGGSNLFRPGGNSQVRIGSAVRATTDDGTGVGIYFDSTTAKVSLQRGADLSGMTTFTGGSAGYIDRAGRVSTNIGDNATTAVATQEILKEFTFAAAGLKVGQKLRIRAWGSVAANANAKTVQLYFGPSGSLSALVGVSIGTGSAFAWYFDVEIWLTGSATQDYAVRINNGNNAQVVRGTLTKALSSALIVSLRGTNGTASAGDIVARGLEVEVVS